MPADGKLRKRREAVQVMGTESPHTSPNPSPSRTGARTPRHDRGEAESQAQAEAAAEGKTKHEPECVVTGAKRRAEVRGLVSSAAERDRPGGDDARQPTRNRRHEPHQAPRAGPYTSPNTSPPKSPPQQRRNRARS
jgi:hypothetical protein